MNKIVIAAAVIVVVLAAFLLLSGLKQAQAPAPPGTTQEANIAEQQATQLVEQELDQAIDTVTAEEIENALTTP